MKTILKAGLTVACMNRIMAGEIEQIEVGPDTILEIRRSEKIEGPIVGIRGDGMYLFADESKATANER